MTTVNENIEALTEAVSVLTKAVSALAESQNVHSDDNRAASLDVDSIVYHINRCLDYGDDNLGKVVGLLEEEDGTYSLRDYSNQVDFRVTIERV